MKHILIAFLFICAVACTTEEKIEQVFHYTESNKQFDYEMVDSLKINQLESMWNQDSIIYNNECVGNHCTLQADGFVQEISYFSESDGYGYKKHVSLFFFDNQSSVINFLNEYMHINGAYIKGDTSEINENWIVFANENDSGRDIIDAYIQKWNTIIWVRIYAQNNFEKTYDNFTYAVNKLISRIEIYSSNK